MKKFLAASLVGIALAGCSAPTPSQPTSSASANATNTNAMQSNVNAPEALVAEKKIAPAAGLVKYTGTWFDVMVPADFEASPALEAADRAQTDEARFTSPDGSVEFYVYSPQWGGTTEYFGLAPDEEMVDSSVTQKGEGVDATTMEYTTVRAKDGSYKRSVVFISKGSVVTGSLTQHGFGIRYKDQAAYDKYKEAYVAFKESLQQYAD